MTQTAAWPWPWSCPVTVYMLSAGTLSPWAWLSEPEWKGSVWPRVQRLQWRTGSRRSDRYHHRTDDLDFTRDGRIRIGTQHPRGNFSSLNLGNGMEMEAREEGGYREAQVPLKTGGVEPAAGGERRVYEKSREEPDDPGKRTRRQEQVPGSTREEGLSYLWAPAVRRYNQRPRRTRCPAFLELWDQTVCLFIPQLKMIESRGMVFIETARVTAELQLSMLMPCYLPDLPLTIPR